MGPRKLRKVTAKRRILESGIAGKVSVPARRGNSLEEQPACEGAELFILTPRGADRFADGGEAVVNLIGGHAERGGGLVEHVAFLDPRDHKAAERTRLPERFAKEIAFGSVHGRMGCQYGGEICGSSTGT